MCSQQAGTLRKFGSASTPGPNEGTVGGGTPTAPVWFPSDLSKFRENRMANPTRRPADREDTAKISFQGAESALPFALEESESPTAPGTSPLVSVAPVTNGVASGSPPEPAITGAAKPDLDPFDPARLRLSQDFASAVGVRKVLSMVPVKKPEKTWWIRTHSSPDYRLQTGLLELKEERETYLVDPALWPALAAEPAFGPRLLVTSLSRQGVVFLWPPSPARTGRRTPGTNRPWTRPSGPDPTGSGSMPTWRWGRTGSRNRRPSGTTRHGLTFR
jgi:hypothetical protein